MVLAVGDDQERARAGLRALSRRVERPVGHAEGAREVGALDAHHLGVGGAEEQAERAPVGRQRALEERLAGEHDEPHAVAPPLGDDALDLELGPLEPRRRHVLGAHRVRHVEGDEEVEALLPRLADRRPRARPGEGDAEARERRRHKPRPHTTTPDDRREPLALPPRPLAEEQPERREPPPRRVREREQRGANEDGGEAEDEGIAERQRVMGYG